MATESSAIERFIELQQKERIYGSGEPLPTDPTDPFTPVERRRTPFIIVLSLLGAGAAIAAGIVGAKTRFWVSEGAPGPAVEGSAAASPLAPPPAPAAAVAPESEGEERAEEPAAGAAEPEPSAEADADTGFDLRVEPKGAGVLLDGEELGEAPLRVRNLAPGRHAIQVTAPEGYFSKHLEIELERGEARDLRVELEPVETAPLVEPLAGEEEAEAKPEDGREEARAERRARRERRSRRQRRRARREAEPRTADEGARAGVLRLGSKPPMEIYIDGAKTGLETPERSIELSPGKHRILLVNREFGLKDRFQVRIAPDKTTTVLRDLSDRL